MVAYDRMKIQFWIKRADAKSTQFAYQDADTRSKDQGDFSANHAHEGDPIYDSTPTNPSTQVASQKTETWSGAQTQLRISSRLFNMSPLRWCTAAFWEWVLH